MTNHASYLNIYSLLSLSFTLATNKSLVALRIDIITTTNAVITTATFWGVTEDTYHLSHFTFIILAYDKGINPH